MIIKWLSVTSVRYQSVSNMSTGEPVSLIPFIREMFRRLPHETFRVRLIRHIENRLTLFEDARGLPVVNHRWRQQAKPE